MVENSQPKAITDDFNVLIDLVKEGASYLLHIWLSLLSKTFSTDFTEKLFDHHKNSSSYDYSKDGKTYIYRLFNCIFEVEKHLVAMVLKLVHSYFPLPVIKTFYENFCVTNNLECTDVKLKECKRALINSSKDTKKKQNKTKDEDDDAVSRPFPSIPQTPISKTENTVSDPKNNKPNLSLLNVNSDFIENQSETDSRKHISPTKSPSQLVVPPIYTSAPTLNNKPKMNIRRSFSTDTVNSLIPSSLSLSKHGQSESEVHSQFGKPETSRSKSSESVRVPQSTPSSASPKLNKNISKIPVKVPSINAESLSSFPTQNSTISSNSDEKTNKSLTFSRNENTSSPIDISSILTTPKLNITSLSESTPKKTVTTNAGDFSNPPSLTSNENNIKTDSNPFQDIGNIFNPPTTPSSTDTKTLFSNPFVPTSTTSSPNASSSLLHPIQTFSPPFPPTSSETTLSPSLSASNIFQTPLPTATKTGESLSPISKKIPPSVDFGNPFEETIQQNNKAVENNMGVFGVSNVFGEPSSSAPTSSANN